MANEQLRSGADTEVGEPGTANGMPSWYPVKRAPSGRSSLCGTEALRRGKCRLRHAVFGAPRLAADRD